MVLNLNITNCLPLKPFRFCLKMIGPGLSSLIAIAVSNMIEAKKINESDANTMSIARLIKRSRPLNGARWISIAAPVACPTRYSWSTSGPVHRAATAPRPAVS